MNPKCGAVWCAGIFAWVSLLAAGREAAAAIINGRVSAAGGAPIAGAMVSLVSGEGLFVESVYSGRDGRYSLSTHQAGRATLVVRRPYYANAQSPLDSITDAQKDFSLEPLREETQVADSLSASAHFTRIRFPRALDKQWFQVECLTCHQIGNSFTRLERSSERWHQIVTRMLGFYGVKDAAQIDDYASRLQTAFTAPFVPPRQMHRVDDMILSARIIEWKLPTGVVAHDVELRSADGRFYTVDQGSDRIYITDPRSNRTETYQIPAGDIPQGGKFFKLMGEPAPVGLAVARGPHSLQLGKNGHYYTTDAISGQIGEFDPDARTFVGHEVGGNSLYPHTLRVAKDGRVWFTISFSNQVGMFDPATGAMKVIDLPADTDRPRMPSRVPYGIDVNPVDGSIWYSSMMANRIGRIDPVTFAVKSFRPPAVGPRRMRFAADGTLWIPDFGAGRLLKLDTRSMRYKSYPIPPLSPGEVEAPYAVGVHPQTQEVWITANMSDRMFRFLPKQQRFIAYPLPVRGIYLRDIIFSPEGLVCSASSPIPAAATVEGGMQEILCLDPAGSTPMPSPAR